MLHVDFIKFMLNTQVLWSLDLSPSGSPFLLFHNYVKARTTRKIILIFKDEGRSNTKFLQPSHGNRQELVFLDKEMQFK